LSHQLTRIRHQLTRILILRSDEVYYDSPLRGRQKMGSCRGVKNKTIAMPVLVEQRTPNPSSSPPVSSSACKRHLQFHSTYQKNKRRAQLTHGWSVNFGMINDSLFCITPNTGESRISAIVGRRWGSTAQH
jgi:hypothetical protein